MEEEKKSKLPNENIIHILNVSEEPSSPFSFLEGGKIRPDKTAIPHPKKSVELSELAGDKTKRLEEELAQEKEKSLRAELTLKERENMRLEMENMFKTLKEQFRYERSGQEMEKEREANRARVQVLEARLEEMNKMYLAALQEQEKPLQNLVSRQIFEDAIAREKQLLETEKELRQILAKREQEIVTLIGQVEEKFAQRFRAHIAQLETALEESRKESEQKSHTIHNLHEAHSAKMLELQDEIARSRELIEKKLAESFEMQVRILEGQLRDARKQIDELLHFRQEYEDLKLNERVLSGENEELRKTLEVKGERLIAESALLQEKSRVEEMKQEYELLSEGMKDKILPFKELYEKMRLEKESLEKILREKEEEIKKLLDS